MLWLENNQMSLEWEEGLFWFQPSLEQHRCCYKSQLCRGAAFHCYNIALTAASGDHNVANETENKMCEHVQWVNSGLLVTIGHDSSCPALQDSAGQPSPESSTRSLAKPLQQAVSSKRITSPILWCHCKATRGLTSWSTPPPAPPPPLHFPSLNGAAHHDLEISSQV